MRWICLSQVRTTSISPRSLNFSTLANTLLCSCGLQTTGQGDTVPAPTASPTKGATRLRAAPTHRSPKESESKEPNAKEGLKSFSQHQ